MTCDICLNKIEKNELTGWDQGNNGWTLTRGRVCDICNDMVLQARTVGYDEFYGYLKKSLINNNVKLRLIYLKDLLRREGLFDLDKNKHDDDDSYSVTFNYRDIR